MVNIPKAPMLDVGCYMSCPFAYPVACMFYYVLLEVVSQSLKPVKLRANGRNNSQQCWELKMKRWSSQWTQFMQLCKEAWKKFRTSTGFEPVTSRLPLRCSTNWAMKPLTLGAGQLWVHMFPWKKWVLMIYEIIIYELRKWNENEEMIVAVNPIYAIA